MTNQNLLEPQTTNSNNMLDTSMFRSENMRSLFTHRTTSTVSPKLRNVRFNESIIKELDSGIKQISRTKSRFISADNINLNLRNSSFEINLINDEPSKTYFEENYNSMEIEELDVFKKNEPYYYHHQALRKQTSGEQMIITEEMSNNCLCYDVLIVDDDLLNINYIKNIVKNSKFRFECASDGQDAFDKFKLLVDSQCDNCEKNLIIFMDIHMPILNGIDSALLIDKYIKNDNLKWNIKLYFISGNVDSQFDHIIKDISIVSGYYNKPINRKQITSMLTF
jgi:CheY-like chemotaxis protein